MYYLISVDHNGMVAYVTRSDYKDFWEMLCIQWSGWDWW